MFSAVRGSFFIRHLGEGFRYLRISNQRKRRRKSSSVASSILALVCFVARRLDSIYVHSSFTSYTSGTPAFARSSISFPPHHSIGIDSGLHDRSASLFGQHPFSRSHSRRDSQDNRRSLELSAGRRCRHTTTAKPRQRSSWKIDSSIFLGIDDTTYQTQARNVQSETKDVGFEHLSIHRRTPSKAHPAQGTSDKRRGVTDKATSTGCQGLDSQWPDAPGEDVPFEFHHMEEAAGLPCSIQLAARGDRSSLVYVDGIEVNRRNSLSSRNREDEGALRSRDDSSMEAFTGGGGGCSCDGRGGQGIATGRQGDFAIRLIGEMAISKPAYLQVQEGSNGRRGTLTVSQFGLTRGGAVTSIDIDPPMLASSPLSSDAVVETAEEDAGLGTLGRRPKPRLKDTWSAPLLWPNEVNQVPPAVSVRLARGMDEEQQFLTQQEQRREVYPESTPGNDGARQDGTLFPGAVAAQAGDKVSRSISSRRGTSSSSSTGASEFVDPSSDGILPEDAFLVADGFLMPGKADGGVYVVRPASAGVSDDAWTTPGGGERIARLTGLRRGWFYHKAVWLVLPGGKKYVLTARVHKPLFGEAEGQLVLLEMPQVERPLAEHSLPWRETVLVEGPDVMFEVVDMDPSDETIEVVCAEFFGGRLTMHSIWGGGSSGARPSVAESWVLDDNSGPAYAVTAADLRGGSPNGRPTHFLVTTHECTYDYSFFSPTAAGGGAGADAGADAGAEGHGGASNERSIASELSSWSSATPSREGLERPAHPPAVVSTHDFETSAGRWPKGEQDGFTGDDALSNDKVGTVWREDIMDHRRWDGIVTGSSLSSSSSSSSSSSPTRLGRDEADGGHRLGGGGDGGSGSGGDAGGGALLAYEIPQDWRVYPRVYPSPGWRRFTLASGFRVRRLGINPGSPGFPYTFHPHKSLEGQQSPYIALAGDCSQAAYILRPTSSESTESRSGIGGSRAQFSPHESFGEMAVLPGSEQRDVLLQGKRCTEVSDVTSASRPTQGSISYEVACVIELPGTVGSLAISYSPMLGEGHFVRAEHERATNSGGWAKLFVPNYDGNRVFVFSMEAS